MQGFSRWSWMAAGLVSCGAIVAPVLGHDAASSASPRDLAAADNDDAELAARPMRECDQRDDLDLRSTWTGTLWPGGIVPYSFNANTTPTMQAQMCEAMDELHTVCNVTFVPRTTEANYLNIQNSTGNNSFIGMIGGSQTVNIFNWNFKYIMAHELMHALGMRHEQSRPDRDTFVQINAANICQDCCSGGPCNSNFNIASSASTIGAYDFESVMHYAAAAFSINGQPTIQCIAPYTQFQSVIGNRNYLSTGDKNGLVARYGLPIDDAFEPNDAFAAALAISGSSVPLRLIDRDDYFRVNLPAGQRTISISGWPAAVGESARLWLQTTAGATLASPFLTAGAAPGTTTASITTTLSSGTYIIRVSRSCGQGGPYTLTLPVGCRADVNNSGGVSVQDIFDFLMAYFSGAPAADFNASGSISVQDIFDFLALYFTCA